LRDHFAFGAFSTSTREVKPFWIRLMSGGDPPRNLTHTVVRGAGLASGGLVLTQALTLAIYIVLARLATPHTFGTLAAASIFVAVGDLFIESGMTAAVIQRRDRLEDAFSTAFAATFLGGILFTLLSAALAPLAGLYFQSHQITLVAAAIAGSHFFTGAAVVPDALLQRRFSFVRRLIVDPLAIVALGVVSAITLAHGFGVWGLVLGSYAQGVTRLVLTWAFVGWRPELNRISLAMWRELTRYGRHVLASEILRDSSRSLNTLLIGRFISAGALGQYRFGWRIAQSVVAPVLAASTYVVFPAFARISGEEARYRAAFLRALRLVCFLVIPMTLILVVIGEPLTILLLGERWRTAGWVLTALAPLGVGYALGSITANVFKASGQPEILAKASGISAGLTMVLSVAFLPLGPVGIAAGASIGAIVVGAWMLREAIGIIGSRWRSIIPAIWQPTAAACAMAVGVGIAEWFAFDAASRGTILGLVCLALEVLLGAVIYFSLMTIIGRDTVFEALRLIQHLNPRAKVILPSERPENRALPADSDPDHKQPVSS
jgi:PST family polysaccharide transporter